jgi:hypothetical protein
MRVPLPRGVSASLSAFTSFRVRTAKSSVYCREVSVTALTKKRFRVVRAGSSAREAQMTIRLFQARETRQKTENNSGFKIQDS